MPAGQVEGFLPSTHGFRFANRFPPGPTVRLGAFDPRVLGIGDAAAGLCGGMALTIRDLFEAGIEVPPDGVPPGNGSPRFVALVRRQVQSLDWLRVPLRYFDLQALRPDPPTPWSRRLGRLPARVQSIEVEWPRIRVDIDAGRLPERGGPEPTRVTGAQMRCRSISSTSPECPIGGECGPRSPDVATGRSRAPLGSGTAAGDRSLLAAGGHTAALVVREIF